MKYFLIIAVLGIIAMAFLPKNSISKDGEHAYTPHNGLVEERPDLPYVTIAGGCFWCVEAEYRVLSGVKYTESGYTGGHLENPTYQNITTGKTGHAEANRIYYDPSETNEASLLRYFFEKAHDPTQLNRQGVDVGTQYRSAVFYTDEEQKTRVETLIEKINGEGAWDKPIVTTLEPAATFYVAEEYHQQFYEKYEDKTGQPHIRVIYKLINKGK